MGEETRHNWVPPKSAKRGGEILEYDHTIVFTGYTVNNGWSVIQIYILFL